MKETLKARLGSSLHSQRRCRSCGFTSASQRQLEGVLMSWMQCSLRGCLQGGLKRIKDRVMVSQAHGHLVRTSDPHYRLLWQHGCNFRVVEFEKYIRVDFTM